MLVLVVALGVLVAGAAALLLYLRVRRRRAALEAARAAFRFRVVAYTTLGARARQWYEGVALKRGEWIELVDGKAVRGFRQGRD